ncbi:cadherin repeat domain-containing protein, partial [Aeromonas rivipollensis]|uniref:cadherin repeat domain-containing protein n=1 Tax=Aeromonas rivipollensis TaxID=948519 RepID=UPI00259FD104
MQSVYTAAASDAGIVTYSLKAGADAALLSINASTGAVTLIGNPDHESKPSYSFTVVATDAAGNASEQAVTLNINDLDDLAPTITSGATASAIDENSGAGQLVYTVTSTDGGDVSTGSTSYSLKAGADAALLSIDAATGAVTLTGNPDHESKASYSFTVVATDAAGNASEQAVTLNINDLDEVAPTITSGATASAIDENSGAGQLVYTITSTDNGDVSTGSTSYSLKAGADAALLSIDAATGAVTLTGNPDHESKASYSFTVVATDAAGNASEQTVTLNINDLDEVAPTITSAATASAINENSGAGQLVYTVTSTDNGDVSTGSTSYSLKAGADAALFSIDAATGAVTLIGNPDHENKPSYSFTVVVTDAAGNASEQAVTLNINDLDDLAPTITSGATASAIDENSGAGQLVYTITSTDNGDVSTGSTSYSLKAGADAALLSIDAATGAVTLTGNPDHESKASYSFTVVATDAAGNASEQTVTLNINDLDEVA